MLICYLVSNYLSLNMKHVSIIVPNGESSIVNIGGTHQMLSWVNEFSLQTGTSPLFELQLVGVTDPLKGRGGNYTVRPEVFINELDKTDLIVIPAIFGDFMENRKLNSPLIPWLIKQYKQGAEIATMCVGAFFLAETGLLDGRPCSTHWQYAPVFREMFPQADLQDDRILTDADGIYTCGGAYSFTNLVIYLIEKYAGREVAVQAAKGFMVDIDRNSQSPFIIFSGQKSHNDREVLKAQDFIEENYREKISVGEIADELAVGRRTFERRFKKATANTVVEYIQRVKVEAAKKSLEKGRKSVNEVMYEVGYSDSRAFREVFRKITDMTPYAYLKKYQQAN